MGIALIILDFDGTIVESVDIKTEAFRELFGSYPAMLDRIMAYHLSHNGISREVKFKYIFEQILGRPYDAALREATARQFSALVFDRVVSCPFVPGAQAFLERFAPRVPIYVVSASPHDELIRVIQARHLARYLRGFFGSPEPKRQIVSRILAGEAVRPGAAIYVGDSLEDYRVARELGVSFIGRRNREDLSAVDAPVYPDLLGVADDVAARLVGAGLL